MEITCCSLICNVSLDGARRPHVLVPISHPVPEVVAKHILAENIAEVPDILDPETEEELVSASLILDAERPWQIAFGVLADDGTHPHAHRSYAVIDERLLGDLQATEVALQELGKFISEMMGECSRIRAQALSEWWNHARPILRRGYTS